MPPIPFPRNNDLPIVGQPCSINAWFPTLSLTCNCDAQRPVLVVGFNNLSVCPACGRGFQLHGVKQDSRTGEPPHFDINIVVPVGAGESSAKPS